MTNAKSLELQNKYAYNSEHNPVFIANAESGKKGYYCMGCGKEMQAVKSKTEERVSYFRHDAAAAKRKGRCKFSDEAYRHKLAIESLLISKRIKVPALYKFSSDRDSPAMLLQKARVIEAHTAKAGVLFYENDLGKIVWTHSKEINEAHIIFEPHVTFFDRDGVPILFIEMVSTHKPQTNKLLTLLHLGIDTISVKVPNSSPEEIAEAFTHTRNTKWLYNYEEATTEYIRISTRNTEGVQYLDEEQRKLFRESLRCRKAHLNNIIRRIRKSLESESYESIESRIGSEISRVERDSDKLRNDIEKQAGRYREKLSEEYGDVQSESNKEEGHVEKRYRNLEGRYFRKRKELEEDERRLFELINSTISQIDSVSGSNESDGQYVDEKIRRIEREERDIEGFISSTIDAGNNSRRRFESEIGRKREAIDRIKREAESIPTEFNVREQEIASSYTRQETYILQDIERERTVREKLSERFRLTGEAIQVKFEQLNRSVPEAIERRDFNHSPYLSERHQNLLYGERILRDLLEAQSSYKRLSEIRKFIESGHFKEWL